MPDDEPTIGGRGRNGAAADGAACAGDEQLGRLQQRSYRYGRTDGQPRRGP